MSLGLSVLRRLRRECLWGTLGSLFGLRTRDSDVFVYEGCGQSIMAFGRIIRAFSFFLFLILCLWRLSHESLFLYFEALPLSE